MRQVVWIIVLIALAGCGSTAATSPTATPAPEGVTVIEPPEAIDEFTLTRQTGEPFGLTDLAGKPVLMAFGYTHCPDVCPVTLARFKQVKAELAAQGSDLNYLFISVDGKRDTPERMSEYLGAFDPTFIGLTGEETVVREVIKQYGGDFVINNAGGLRDNYTVDHTAAWFLMDGQGRLIRVYSYNSQPEIMADDIKTVLAA